MKCLKRWSVVVGGFEEEGKERERETGRWGVVPVLPLVMTADGCERKGHVETVECLKEGMAGFGRSFVVVFGSVGAKTGGSVVYGCLGIALKHALEPLVVVGAGWFEEAKVSQQENY